MRQTEVQIANWFSVLRDPDVRRLRQAVELGRKRRSCELARRKGICGLFFFAG